MTEPTDPEALVRRLVQLGQGGRTICAIAGAPGSGKSTLAERLVDRLNEEEPGSAALLPMDGFHYDDLYLVPAGLRPRKGSPETWVAVVKPGKVMFELSGVPEPLARDAMRLAANKLPIRCKFVTREGG